MRRSALLPIVIAVLIAGCGDTATSTQSARRGGARAASTAPAPSSPILVAFKDAIGVDPTVSQLTVDTHGHAAAVIILGGLNGAKTHVVTLPAAQLHRLRRLVGRAKLVDTRFGNPNHNTYWVTVHGHAWRMSQAYVPRSARPLIHFLSSLLDAYIHF